jgi:altronate hydrolase
VVLIQRSILAMTRSSASRPLRAGDIVTLDGHEWALRDAIEAKHKFCRARFSAWRIVTMYGAVIGRAKRAIRAGEWLSQENVAHATVKAVVRGQNFSLVPP